MFKVTRLFWTTRTSNNPGQTCMRRPWVLKYEKLSFSQMSPPHTMPFVWKALVAQCDPTLHYRGRTGKAANISQIQQKGQSVPQRLTRLVSPHALVSCNSCKVIISSIRFYPCILYSTISKNDAMLQSLYAKWKIQYVKPSPAAAQGDSGLSNAELALIIIGSLVALCLLLGLCFAIKTRCRCEPYITGERDVSPVKSLHKPPNLNDSAFNVLPDHCLSVTIINAAF